MCVRIPCSYGDPARIHYYSAVVVVPAINVLDERQRVISRHRNWDGDQQRVCGARLRNKAGARQSCTSNAYLIFWLAQVRAADAFQGRVVSRCLLHTQWLARCVSRFILPGRALETAL